MQIKRREEGQALGAENKTTAASFSWSDQFWIDVYNSSASKLTKFVNENKKTSKKESKNKKDKSNSSKKKKVEESEDEEEEDDMSDFELVIEKSSKGMLGKSRPVRSRSNSNVKEKKTKDIKKNKDKK